MVIFRRLVKPLPATSSNPAEIPRSCHGTYHNGSFPQLQNSVLPLAPMANSSLQLLLAYNC